MGLQGATDRHCEARPPVLRIEGTPADNAEVPACSICGHQLQTLDLPCPACSAEALGAEVDTSESREFSETIHYRRMLRYRPQEFVDQVNRWLIAHPGIVGVAAGLQRDREGVRSITFTCQAVLDPVPLRGQVACIPLRSPVGRRLYRDPGEAISAWLDANPTARRLNHWIFANSGNASEVWLLFAVPASELAGSAQEATVEVGRPRRRVLAVALKVTIRLAVILAAFFTLGFVVVLLGEHGAGRNGDLRDAGIPLQVCLGILLGLQHFRRSPIQRGRDHIRR